jgi:hypothetical protein
VRATLLVIVALAAGVIVAGCGSSGDQTSSLNGQEVTVPGDVHDVYGEVEAFLDQLPYQSWYTRCVVQRLKGALSPTEAEALSELPEAAREKKATAILAKVGPACEESTDRPLVDPNASSKELDLLRAGDIASVGESTNFTAAQNACVETGFEELPDSEIVEIGNGTPKARDAILLSVIKPCAKAK